MDDGIDVYRREIACHFFSGAVSEVNSPLILYNLSG